MGMYRRKPTLAELYDELPTLFAGMALPVGLDSSVMRGMILQELGELQTVFPRAADAAAYITIWSAAHLDAWQRMLNALAAEYDPIHNYDRTDTETETVAGSGTEQRSRSDTEKIRDSQNSSFSGSSQASGSDTTSEGRQGFNSSTYAPADQTVVQHGAGNDSRSATTTAGTQQRETGGQESVKRGETETRSRTLRSAGNIGMTTNQMMIEAEISMRSKWTLYGIICEAFKRDFCVEVW